MFKTIWKCIFVIYILMVLNFIVIKFNGDIHSVLTTIQANAERRAAGELVVNLVLFQTIDIYTSNINSRIPFINILGNIIPFIPIGFIILMAFHSQRNIIKTMTLCLLLICNVEILQLIFFLGSFDIDDIILNQLSSFIGFMLFITCKNVFKVVH